MRILLACSSLLFLVTPAFAGPGDAGVPYQERPALYTCPDGAKVRTVNLDKEATTRPKRQKVTNYVGCPDLLFAKVGKSVSSAGFEAFRRIASDTYVGYQGGMVFLLRKGSPISRGFNKISPNASGGYTATFGDETFSLDQDGNVAY